METTFNFNHDKSSMRKAVGLSKEQFKESEKRVSSLMDKLASYEDMPSQSQICEEFTKGLEVQDLAILASQLLFQHVTLRSALEDAGIEVELCMD